MLSSGQTDFALLVSFTLQDLLTFAAIGFSLHLHCLLDPIDSVCVFTHSVHGVECARGVRAAWRALFFFLLVKKELAMVPDSETFSPVFHADIRTSSSFSSDVEKKCALVALHLIAEEGRDGEGCHALGLGDEWGMGCPKGPVWESGDEALSKDESASSDGSREDNVCNEALHVIGLFGLGKKISPFLEGLGADEGGIELPHGPGHAVPGNARGLVAGLPLPRGPLSQQGKPFSFRGRAVTQGEGCGERK